MPVQANMLANMGTFSLQDTVSAAEETKYMRVRNELLGYEAEREGAANKRRKKRVEIEELFAAMPARIDEYERLGMHKEAEETKKALLSGKEQELRMFEILAQSLDALTEEARPGSWLKMRQQALEAGMFEADGMPDRYEDGGQHWIDSWLKKVGGELKELNTTYGEDPSEDFPEGRTMTQERWQRDGQVVREFDPYEAKADRNARVNPGGGSGGRGKAWEYSATDNNALLAEAKIQFDAILDDNGNFVGIRGEGDRALAQLMERASRLMVDAGGPMQLTHAEAIAKAGREQGLEIKSTVDANANNPLNLPTP